ncbi:UDP-N-acetylglucosamine 1-carboxyvinyltransferase [Candidatus Gracilibacteria bacterium]|nr:UDP-N-acetylglucosamine 1-carboxyvinyltransferase [Candidatus Gracilibacteria bacterium]
MVGEKSMDAVHVGGEAGCTKAVCAQLDERRFGSEKCGGYHTIVCARGGGFDCFGKGNGSTKRSEEASIFEVEGGHRLEGEIRISGAKNAALPMLCASLLTPEKCVFRDVPAISDIEVLLDIFRMLGATVDRDFKNQTVSIEAKNIDPTKLKNCPLARKMRASILMLGPLLARFGEVDIPLPGGCVIGARPNSAHLDAFSALGVAIDADDQHINLNFERKTFLAKRVLFSEASVTATENLAIFCAGIADEAELFFTAAESHVVATTKMLEQMGAKIEGIGTHSLKIRGTKKLKGGEFIIPSDDLLVGTYAIASVLTGGDLLIKNVDHRTLLSFYGLFERAGANFEMLSDSLRVLPSPVLRSIPKLQTAIFPGFSTDLQSPFGVLLTQCEGESLVFETLFENRLTYLMELEKMGAKVQMLNPHQAKITGKTKLSGASVQSWDLRAGAAMVLAGLVTEGVTRISNVNYIDRGYENFPENLVSLGAKIVRSE